MEEVAWRSVQVPIDRFTRMARKLVQRLGYGSFGIAAVFALLGWLSFRGIGADFACTGTGCGFAAFIVAILLIIFMIAFYAGAAVFALVGILFVVAANRRGVPPGGRSGQDGSSSDGDDVIDVEFRTKK